MNVDAQSGPGVAQGQRSAEAEKLDPNQSDADKRRWMVGDLDGYLRIGLFILIGVFIALSTFGLYFSINNIIDMWVEDQYVPLAQAIYYIAIISLGLYLMDRYLLKR